VCYENECSIQVRSNAYLLVDLVYLFKIIYRISYFLLWDTFLVTQLASEPTENKHVGSVEDVNSNGLRELSWISQSLKQRNV
jgi:hypothetical protein